MIHTLLLATLAVAMPAASDAMDLHIAGKQLVLSGAVVGDELAKVRDILAGNPGIETVVLQDSRGGKMWTAIQLGDLIAERGLKTAASGHCRSACVLIFLGGRERNFAEGKPGSQTYLAIHSPVSARNASHTWPPPGSTAYSAQGGLVHWMVERIGPEADRALIARGVENDHPDGLMYFFDYIRHSKPDGISVYQCKGPEKRKVADCEKIPRKNALQAGLITSERIVELEQ
jgi:hypothetical protein